MLTSIVSQPGTMAKTQSTTELLFCTCIQTGSRQTIKVTTVAVADPEGSGPEDWNPPLFTINVFEGGYKVGTLLYPGLGTPSFKMAGSATKTQFQLTNKHCFPRLEHQFVHSSV